MTRVVDDKRMIIKPAVYGRSEKLYEEGDEGEFRSMGWIITGRVQSIRMFDDEPFVSSDGYYVYLIDSFTKDEWVGLERTEEEEIEYQIQLNKERQQKFKF